MAVLRVVFQAAVVVTVVAVVAVVVWRCSRSRCERSIVGFFAIPLLLEKQNPEEIIFLHDATDEKFIGSF